MTDVLVALLGVTAVAVATLVAGALLVRWRLRRANRVHPKVATPAPTTWLVAPSTPARLHRRLQATVRVAALPTTGRAPSAVVEVACALDQRLVLASRLPAGRRGRALRSLATEVDELDRLALAATRALEPAAGEDPRQVLALLAEARAEVEALDGRHQLSA